jgi:TP901 family phage tail tape measure protein
MANAELSVVIQLRDLLTKELDRLNGVLAQFESKASAGFQGSASAATAAQSAVALVADQATRASAALAQAGAAGVRAGAETAQAGASASAAFVSLPASVARALDSLTALGPKGTIAAAQIAEGFRESAVAANVAAQAAAGIGPAATLAAAQAQTANQAAIASVTQLGGALAGVGATAQNLGAVLARAAAAASAAFIEIPDDVSRAAESLTALGPKGTIAAAQMTESFRVSAAAADRAAQAATGIGLASTLAAAQAQTANQTAIASATQLGGAVNYAASQTQQAAVATANAGRAAGQAAGQATSLATGFQGVGSNARAASAAATSFANTMRSALLPLLPFLTAAGAGFAALQSINSASSFGREIAAISTIATDGKTSIESLRREVIELSKQYGQAPVDQARGLYLAISSGAENAAEGLDILRASTRLAIAGLATTEGTVDLITAALNSYANQNLQAADAADILFKTVELGKGRVEDLALNYGRALPLGAALNISFKELSATMASLTLTQGSVEQASTSLRSVLSGLLQITDEQRESLRGLGADVTPQAIGVNGLVKTLVDLADALKKDTDATRAIFPDIRALSGVLALVNDGGEDLLRVLGRFGQSAGSVGRALDTQLAEPANQLIRIINAAKVSFNEAFGRAVLDGVSRAAQRMGGVTSAVELVSDAAGRLGQIFAQVIPSAISFVEELIKTFERATREMGGTMDAVALLSKGFATLAEVVILGFAQGIQVLDGWKDAIFGVAEALGTIDVNQLDFDAVGSALVVVGEATKAIEGGAKLSTEQISALGAASTELGRSLGPRAKELRESLSGVMVENASLESLRSLTKELNQLQNEIGSVIQRGGVTGALRRAITEVDVDIEPMSERLRSLIKRTFEGDISGSDISVPIDLQVEAKEQEVARIAAAIENLKLQAAQVNVGGRSSTISLDFTDGASERATAVLEGIVAKSNELQGSLRTSQEDLSRLKKEARDRVLLDIDVKTAQLEKMRSGLIDSRSAVEALGLSAEQVGLLSDQEIKTTAIERVERELEQLRRKAFGQPVELRLQYEQADLAGIERSIDSIRERAQDVVKLEADDSEASEKLGKLAGVMQALQASANAARKRVSELKAEARGEIQVKIEAKKAELEALSQSMADARSVAAQLGLNAEQAGRLLDKSFQSGKADALKAEIVDLDRELKALEDTTVVVAKSFDFKRIAGTTRAAIDKLVDGLRIFERARDAIGKAQTPDFIDDAVEAFRGGVEPSLERQVELIDKQVAKQRLAVAEMRRLGLVSNGVAGAFSSATDALEASAAALIAARQRARQLLEFRASETGIDVRVNPGLDDDALQRLIDDTERSLDLAERAGRFGIEIVPGIDETALAREVAAAERDLQTALDGITNRNLFREAFVLGVSVDSRSLGQLERDVALAREAIQAEMDKLSDSATRRQAISFGISLDDRSIADLELEIAKAQASAQEYLDGLADEQDRREALRIGIDVEGVPPEVLRQLIAGAQAQAQKFSEENPITADLLVGGVEQGARAFADIASGAKTGREAVQEFFQSMAQQATYAIAKLLIVNSLIRAFGAQSAVGQFLSVTFGAAKGAAFPAGGVVPFAKGGVPSLQAVQAFAKGDAMRVEREVKAYGTVVHEGLPAGMAQAFASGGVPRNQVVRSPQVAPLALFGEAGPEAIMPLDQNEGVRGLSPAGVTSLPLTRDGQGRLSVDLSSVLAGFAAGVRELEVGGKIAAGAEQPVRQYAFGGVPSAAREIVRPFASGGKFGVETAQRRVAPPAPLSQFERDASESPRVDVRPNITINVSSLDGQTAAAVILREKKTIAAAVASELRTSNLFRSAVRGDRA